VQSHALASQITAAAPLLTALSGPANETLLQPLQQAFSVVRNNLQQAEHASLANLMAGDTPRAAAEAAAPPPADSAAATLQEQERSMTRELDAMVVSAEAKLGSSTETVQELKLLVHQCKQMISASWLVRHDTSKMRSSNAAT